VRGQAVAVDPQPHHRLTEAGHEHVADPGHGLQPRSEHLIGIVRQLAGIEAGQRHPQHRLGVDVELLDDRRLGVEGQVADRARDLVADVLGGDVDVALEQERDGDLVDALPRVGGRRLMPSIVLTRAQRRGMARRPRRASGRSDHCDDRDVE
jgi:hypothetical protein